MSRFHEVIEKWKEAPPYEGVRVAEWSDFTGLDDLDWLNIGDILTALERQELLSFEYKGRDRLVAPFVFGVSSEGNALMRGYQIEGSSRSGKGAGWRVFQVREMSLVGLYGESFIPEEFDFNPQFPWVYKVFEMLSTDISFKGGVESVGPEGTVEAKGPTLKVEIFCVIGELIRLINNAPEIQGKNKATLEWLRKCRSKTTSIIAGPSTDIEHEAYSVILDGLTIYFDEIIDQVITLIREMASGPQWPKLLKERVIGIQMVEEDARGGPDVIAMSADGIMTIFGNREVDSGVIAHEAAHDFAVNKWGNPVPPADSDYAKAILSGEPPVSEYSKRNWSEDFAEAVRMFVVDPGKLKDIAPARYQVIKRLMEDESYGG